LEIKRVCVVASLFVLAERLIATVTEVAPERAVEVDELGTLTVPVLKTAS
jgi:hypothetical protein